MFRKNKKTRIHFIGIGGIGMSGIAEILHNLGYIVTGSDLSQNAIIERLKLAGIQIFVGHNQDNVNNTDVVVYSSAVGPSNPEIVRAQERKIPILKRAQMLAELMRVKFGLAVAGTHGKTTTTSFLATILKESGLDPTHVIGGVVENLGGNAYNGKGSYLVAEADESDGTFLLLFPTLAVITNIDKDHMDFYQTEENLLNAFTEFANKIPFYGACAVNLDDQGLQKIIKNINRPIVSFGIQKGPSAYDFSATNIKIAIDHTTFDLFYMGKFIQNIKINIPGEHNVYNALGAISLAYELEIPFETIGKSISTCRGVGRRFDLIFSKQETEIIDDYAHHPTEIKTTIKAVRQSRPDKKLWVIYQPHRYTRVKDCWPELLHSFNMADKTWLTPIYSAGENEIEGITSDFLVRDINALHPNQASLLAKLEDVSLVFNEALKQKATVVILGAGSISKISRDWARNVQNG